LHQEIESETIVDMRALVGLARIAVRRQIDWRGWERVGRLDEEGIMGREIEWTDSEEIGIQLQEKFPELDPYTVRFTDLRQYVMGIPGFVGDPAKSNEGILEAIQTAWHEEFEDAKGS
jgi:FeS assembly protein IscX